MRAVPLSRYFENYQQSGAAYPGELAFYRHRDFPTDTGARPSLTRLGRFAVDRLGWPYDGQQIAELAARLTLHRLGAWDHPTTAARLDDGPVVRPLLSEQEGSKGALRPGSGGLADFVPDGSLVNQAYICSEYVAACYAELGIEIACGSCPYVTPGDFVADARIDAISS